MNFDRVAAPYRWFETIVFGDQLQQARVAFVREIGRPCRVLVVGEGNGRFLAEFVRVYPGVPADCVEASERMIELARRRVEDTQVNFIPADVREVALAENAYDLVVAHFFFDCFSGKALRDVVEKLARAATHDATWLVGDFCEPPSGWRRFRARVFIATMYFFFRITAGVAARRLVDYRPLLQARGFTLATESLSPNRMIRSELWRRRPERSARPLLSSRAGEARRGTSQLE